MLIQDFNKNTPKLELKVTKAGKHKIVMKRYHDLTMHKSLLVQASGRQIRRTANG
jgi:hypothetical protein